MRDFHLRFCLEDMERLFSKSRKAKLFGENPSGWFNTNDGMDTFDLLEGEKSVVPDEPGAYVLGTGDGTMIAYPWGTSPIYYIGKADILRNRLSDHRKHTLGARNDHQEVAWLPRYQYGAAFGTDCVWYLAYDNMDPKNLEATLVESFYWSYGAIPVANHKWPKHLEPKQGWPG